MKKCLLCVVVIEVIAFIALMMWGCSGVQVNDEESKNFIYRIAGHRLGYEIAKKDPATAIVAVTTADGIIKSIESGTTAPELSKLLQEGVAKLASGYGNDPALAAEIAMVSELIVFQTGNVNTDAAKLYLEQMRAGLDGFKMGVGIAQAIAAEQGK